jgi:hypothetical protein
MTDRAFDLPGVWAEDANTTIPGSPAQNTPYRNAGLDQATVNQGWPFAKIVDSADFNQFLYLSSLMLQQLSAQGVLSWAPAVAYPVGALALGSDMQLYRCIQTSTNNNPTSSPTYWTLAFSSSLSLASNAETQAGTLATKAVSPAGLASCFAASKAASGWQKLEGGLILQWAQGTNPGTAAQSIAWPIPFPNACIAAFASKILPTGSGSNANCDHIYAALSWTTTAVNVERNGASACDVGAKPIVLGIGY